ncbi:MAG: adenylate/guanylate cyclase domain-containing protein [Chloroflexota bacterium]
MFNRLSVKSKLVLIFLIVSLASALVVGILGWRSSRSALQETIFSNISSLRRNKADQVESYFRNTRLIVEILAENDMVIEAMVRFNRSFRQLENTTVPDEWDSALQVYYENQFFPRLFTNLPGQADYTLFRPKSQAGLYLQYQYVVANRFAIGSKSLLDDAEDGSSYSEDHAYYHPRLRNLTSKFGFYDLFLINLESGDIVYTVFKETEFATNLNTGPYRRSNLAEALDVVRANTERGTAQLIDFDLYRPSYGAPGAFWSAPLYNGNHLVGVLAVQVSLDAINEIMTNHQQWEQVGLGETGETFLVGSDHLMRSDSRARIEDSEAYQSTLTELGVPERTRQLIKGFDTTILLQEIDSPIVTAALENKDGTQFSNNYLRSPVLASYQPLVLEGLQWAIIAEIDRDEAFIPVYQYQRQLVISTVILITILAFLATGISYIFMRPISLLIDGAHSVSDEHSEVSDIKLQSEDEWGELATSFNTMAQSVKQKTSLLDEKGEEIQRLLGNLLPESVVQRAPQGHDQLVDEIQQTTLFAARIDGFSELSQKMSISDVSSILHDLMSDINEASEQYGIELLPESGQRIMAICGLSVPHLDHSQRMSDFALSVRTILLRLNVKHQIQLKLRGGIHNGPLMGSLIRTQKLAYEVWGETATTVQRLAGIATPGTLLASQSIYDRLQELYLFERLADDLKGQANLGKAEQYSMDAWVLVDPKKEEVT